MGAPPGPGSTKRRKLFALEEKAMKLAFQGNTKMLALLLRAEMPEKYGDALKIEHTNIDLAADVRVNREKRAGQTD